jgi:hypothetical protein
VKDLTLDNVTQAIQHSFDGCDNPRLRELLSVLVRYLHNYAKEVRLAPEERLYMVDFLYRAGKISDNTRNEFVVLSDGFHCHRRLGLRDTSSVDHFIDDVQFEQVPLLRNAAKFTRSKRA